MAVQPKMADLNFSQIKEQLLLLFYKLAMDGQGSSLSWRDEMDIRLPGTSDDFLVEQARLGLIEEELLSAEMLSGLHPTAKGLSRAEELLEGEYSLFHHWSVEYELYWRKQIIQGHEDGASKWTLALIPSSQKVPTAGSKQPESVTSAPAANRMVPLNHNSAPYQETVESVDKVIEELKKDQSLDNELGQERHALIQAVEAGRRLLDDTRMNVEIGVKLLLEPLRLVAKKYAQVLLGALASKAVDLVSKLLGLG